MAAAAPVPLKASGLSRQPNEGLTKQNCLKEKRVMAAADESLMRPQIRHLYSIPAWVDEGKKSCRWND